jgi:glycosyltransferase involved in cell wall biosynthesis
VTSSRPVLFIVEGATHVTGALVSASQQALLMADEVDTVLVLPDRHRIPADRTQAFSEVIRLPIVAPRKNIGALVTYFPALLTCCLQISREMRRRGCNRLQLNDFYLLHGAVLRLLGFRGVIATFVRIDPARYGLIGKGWLLAARWSSTELVAVSRFIQCALGPRFPTRLIYSPASIDPVPLPQADPDKPMILFVGNYIEGKGQEHAVNAFNSIAPRYPHSRLRFVGGDMGLDKNRAFRARIERMAASGPAPDRIEFVDFSNDLTTHYAAASVAINFSESESFSITCIDASASGLPVVATRCGGPEEIIMDGETGFLVPRGDVDVMAARLAWLLDHPAEAKRMGVAGRSRVGSIFSASAARNALVSMFSLQTDHAVDADPR